MQRKPHDIFINAKYLEILEVHFIYGTELTVELLLGAIDVCIIHVQAADPHQSKQFTALFITVYCSVFSDTVGQIAVAFWLSRIDLMMVRAVHGSEIIFLSLHFH